MGVAEEGVVFAGGDGEGGEGAGEDVVAELGVSNYWRGKGVPGVKEYAHT